MAETDTLERGAQATLLDVDTRQFDAYWVDPQQPLQVPANPLHFAAHKYQLILARLDVQAAKNPAQFNSGNYIQIMEKLEKLWLDINRQDKNEDLDTRTVASGGNTGAATPDGGIEPISMDS